MRIISGTHKGRRLIAPKKLPVRPTTDMAKEALFNIINNTYYIDELKVLDLFSGTGNIGYEFASRGAKEITCVDGHYACVKFIDKTATELGFPITAIKSDVYKYLDHEREAYDLIFADPPYDFSIELFTDLAGKILLNNLLKPDGIFIIEHPKHTDLSEVVGYQESRKYGGSVFSFFK